MRHGSSGQPGRRVARAALVAIAVVTVACARASGSSVAASRPPVGGDAAAMLAALLEVADTRRPDTVVIDRALRSNDMRVRAYAVRTIGQVRIRARASELRARLRDADSSIAAEAAFALGLMRDSSAIVGLGAALAGPPSVVEAAAWALGEVGEPGRAILGSVLRTGQPATALAPALQAAAKLRPVPVADVAPYLADPDPAVRRGAAYALTRSRVAGAVRPLLSIASRIQALSESGSQTAAQRQLDVEFRSYLARGLARPAAGDSLTEPALAALNRLVEDTHPHIRVNAIRSLATFGEVARPVLVERLGDPDANVRITLAQSLTDVLSRRPEEWISAWSADTAFTYRRFLLTNAMRAGVRLPALETDNPGAWHRHADWRFRAAAAEAAAVAGFDIADEIAGTLLSDLDGRVRNAAFTAVLPFADSTRAVGKPYSRAVLARSLRDPDPLVRATILGALRRGARASDVPMALDAWRHARDDGDNDARIAALGVIAAAWAADSGAFGHRLSDSLAALAPPTDPLERAAVSRVRPLQHWPQTGPTSRPFSWYATQVRDVLVPTLVGRPLRASIVTERGRIDAVLYGADAPLTVVNFATLARTGYYNGLAFHRVVPNFVAQDGDPRGDGAGGPGYAIRDELNRRWYDRGAIGMALSGPDTGGSQYFVAHSSQPHLDGHYTVFAHVTSGFEALDALVQGDRIRSVTIR